MALVSAIGLHYVELAWVSGDPYWLGGTAAEWIQSGFVVAIYWVGLSLLGALVWIATCQVRMNGGVALVLRFLAPVGVTWAVVRPQPAGGTLNLDCAVLAGTVGLTALLAIGARTRRASVWGYSTAWCAAMLGGIAALREGTLTYVLYKDGAGLALLFSAGWAVVSGVVGMGLDALESRRGLGRPIRLLSLVALCFVFPAALRWGTYIQGQFQTPTGPGFVLITADALRADVCSVYGGETPTPALEALAARGARFDRCYATAPWTVPALSSLFAGKYPPGLTGGASDEQREREEMAYSRVAAYWMDRERNSTLIGRLGWPSGYASAAFVGNPAIFLEKWLVNEFRDSYLVASFSSEPYSRRSHFPFLRERLGSVFPRLQEKYREGSTATLTRYAQEFLRHNRRGRFFLWIHFMDPHSPYAPLEAYQPEGVAWSRFPSREREQEVREGRAMPPSPEEKSCARSLYEGEVREVDDAVGKILGTFDAVGMGDRAYFLFSSDHGEEFWDHGRWGHGYTLYDELVRVPMILSGPKLTPLVVTQPVSTIDLMPTIAELLGVEGSSEWRGASWLRFFGEDAASLPMRPVFAQATHYLQYKPEPQQMVVAGQYKLIRGLDSGQMQLFDLGADPGEQRNIAPDNPVIVGELNGRLDAWSKSFPSSFDEVQRGGNVQLPAERSRETEEVYRALGYL